MDNANGSCPLCGDSKHMGKAKSLYGQMVCGKCHAGFANRRQFAFFLDLIPFWIFCFGVGFVAALVAAIVPPLARLMNLGGMTVPYGALLLFCCKDAFSGYSLGKKICGVRVISNQTGSPADIGASFKRNLPLLIPFMPIVVAFDLGRGHRIGDGWSHSKVIWMKYANHPIFAPTAAANPPAVPVTDDGSRRGGSGEQSRNG